VHHLPREQVSQGIQSTQRRVHQLGAEGLAVPAAMACVDGGNLASRQAAGLEHGKRRAR
jgi:hypothetical protein